MFRELKNKSGQFKSGKSGQFKCGITAVEIYLFFFLR